MRRVLPALGIAAAVALWAFTSFAAPPKIKAEVAEPVLEELMGGCSLRCSVVWSVQVQAERQRAASSVKELNDESPQSAWTAARGASGVGTRIRMVFPTNIPKEMDGEVPLYGLNLINGNWKSEALWKQHARLKRARLYYNKRVLAELSFSDSRRWQKVVFDDQMISSGDSLTLEVLEVYPGTKHGLALSELVLEGAH